MDDHDAIYAVGTWAAPAGEGRIAVENPATEQVVAHVPDGGQADVDFAVSAARKALPEWSSLSRTERADYLAALHAGLCARREEMARLITT